MNVRCIHDSIMISMQIQQTNPIWSSGSNYVIVPCVANPFHCSLQTYRQENKGGKVKSKWGLWERVNCNTMVMGDNYCSFFDSSALMIGFSEVGLIPSAAKRSVRLGWERFQAEYHGSTLKPPKFLTLSLIKALRNVAAYPSLKA